MIPTPIWGTLLEKAATDNGFDLEGAREGEWIPFASSQTSPRIWLRVLDGPLYGFALSRRQICRALADPGPPWTDALPPGACAALRLGNVASLHRLIRRAFQLSRALPDAPLQAFLQRTASLPRTTEAERLVVQRVGQDLFRKGLLDSAPRQVLGLDKPLPVHRLDDKHRAFLVWHREHVFRMTAGLPKLPGSARRER